MAYSFPVLRTSIEVTLELIARYHRVEVEGLENLPTRGPAILLPNHSGFLGFDALLLSHVVRRFGRRVPRVLLHRLWFTGGLLGPPARSLGFLEATYANGLTALKRNQVVILFPEGEAGNFKPTKERYRLREFRQGFVRMAARTHAPIVPVLILGAEESHINLGQVRLFNHLLPLPFNIFPLPAKWKIRILPPVRLLAGPRELRIEGRAGDFAKKIRRKMQTELRRELSQRRYIFWEKGA